jgi:DMSO/TMAO reductase YedYZ molybdopterin-dependent catalytic subunit
MSDQLTRRDSLKMGLTIASLFAMPALGQGETDIPFTDYPANFNPNPNPDAPTRFLDIRKIDGHITPTDQFFFIQHYNRPEIDPLTYKLKFTGMVSKPQELLLADIKAMKPVVEVVNGYECSGNSAGRFQGLSSCGKFTGVRLRDVLKKVGVGPDAREVVFFGTDRQEESIVFRANTYKLQQQFGRSVTLENAMKPEPILAWHLNDEPIKRNNGGPLRLIMPGRYGVSNVKWVSEIHLQEDRYLGNFQARWYRTLRGVGGTGEDKDPGTQWVETEVTKMHVKAVLTRARKTAAGVQLFGFVLNDGSPLKAVEVSVDGGAWMPAALDKGNTQFSWKLFTFDWKGAAPGEHTLVARATEVNGRVQETEDELKRKKTFLEDNGQFPRKIVIA